MVYKMRTRPDRLSTMSAYTSWPSLTNRTFSDRHLPPDRALQLRLPPLDQAEAAFLRPEPQERWSDKSTLLFPHFAQWFTDGFLRTDPANPLKNTSTHDIDLSQLYGQTEDLTLILRTRTGGRLKSQIIDGAEYPPYYLDADGNPKQEFAGLPITLPNGDRKAQGVADLPDLGERKLFALGLPRGNIHYGTALMSTIFLREHNRLARLIAEDQPWGDERIFQTARNTLIVMLLKVVIQDYINHITPFWFKFVCEPGTGALRDWFFHPTGCRSSSTCCIAGTPWFLTQRMSIRLQGPAVGHGDTDEQRRRGPCRRGLEAAVHGHRSVQHCRLSDPGGESHDPDGCVAPPPATTITARRAGTRACSRSKILPSKRRSVRRWHAVRRCRCRRALLGCLPRTSRTVECSGISWARWWASTRSPRP